MTKEYDVDTVKGRLVEYIRKIEGIGFREFERRLGFSDGTISRPGGLSMGAITALARNCPLLDLRWLLTGDGTMTTNHAATTQDISGKGASGTIYGDINNTTTVERVCDEVKTLKILVRDLRHDKEMLLASNATLIETLAHLERKERGQKKE